MKGISKIRDFVIQRMENDFSGHDYFHALRVHSIALKLAKNEGNCDIKIIEAASLLHDIIDVKLCKNIKEAEKDCEKIMKDNLFNIEQINHVMDIIRNLSFKGANIDTSMKTIEGKIVQDADRLDAIGAIGIARTFAYGGSKNRLIWDPDKPPMNYKNEDEYRNTNSSTLNHFDEKLLLLKDLMQTESGRKVAEKRHSYLVEFKKKFIDEWYGIDIDDVLL